MSLLKIRKERKELGGDPKRPPRTIALIALLILVLVLINYLDRLS